MLYLSEAKQKKLRIWIRKHGAQYGQLDYLVEAIKCMQANRINNAGIRAQVKFLSRYCTAREIRHDVIGELTQLQRLKMFKQSKCQENGNVMFWKKKKKKRKG